MNWRFKTSFQNAIGWLPGRLPFILNAGLTRLLKGAPLDTVDARQRLQKGIDNLTLLCTKTDFRCEGSNILELGTGWLGIDLLLFYLCGAETIVTIDHYPHLTDETFTQLVDKALQHRKQWTLLIAESGLTSESKVCARFDRLQECREQSADYGELLTELSVQRYIAKSCLTCGLPVRERTIDLFYSESVLQRIPEQDLERILNDMASRLMSPSGVFFHRINPMDVNAHVGNGLWYFNYLRYSDFFFKTFYSGKLTTQNRLREPDFIEMFSRSGLQVLYVGSYMRKEDVQKLGHFKVHPKFAQWTPEQLATFRSKVVGRVRAAGTPLSSPFEQERSFTKGYGPDD